MEAEVESLYSAGMRDYRSGNLEKAKEEFDQALSTLLESDLNIQGDERLTFRVRQSCGERLHGRGRIARSMATR